MAAPAEPQQPQTAVEDAGGIKATGGPVVAAAAATAAATGMKLGVAFDYMRVKVKDIALLEHFAPVLMELYKKEEQEEIVSKPVQATVDEKKKQMKTMARKGEKAKKKATE